MIRNIFCYLLLYAFASCPAHTTSLNTNTNIFRQEAVFVYSLYKFSQTAQIAKDRAFSAAEKGDLGALQKCFTVGIDVNLTRKVLSHEETLLEVAIENAHPNIVEFLVKQDRINMMHKGKNGNNYLHMACKKPELDLGAYSSADIFRKCDELFEKYGNLLHKTNALQLNIVNILLMKLESLKKLKSCINEKNYDLETPLSLAVCNEDSDHTINRITLLLENGANPNIPNRKKETPFTKVVVESGNERMFNVLLNDKKTNINQLVHGMPPVLELFKHMCNTP